MSESVKIECLIKRRGGSEVTFGKNAATQVKYHFKPVDPANPDSPHVADVADDEHINRLLSIPGYRIYRDQAKPLASLALTPEPDNYQPEDEYADLVGIDADVVDGDWLHGFSRKVLAIDPKSKAKLSSRLKKSYEQTLPDGASANDYIRAILKNMIAEQEAASSLAQGNNTETGKELGGSEQNTQQDGASEHTDPQNQ